MSLKNKVLGTMIAAGLTMGTTDCNFKLPTNFQPEFAFKRFIEELPYKADVFDCTQKAILYNQKLHQNGYNSRIVIGRVRTHDKSRHAWVEVQNPCDEQWYLIDPTWKSNTDGFRVDRYMNWNVEEVCEGTIMNEYQLYKACKPCWRMD